MTKSKLFFAKKACVAMLSAAMTLTAVPAMAVRAEGAPVGLATDTDTSVDIATNTDVEPADESYKTAYENEEYKFVWSDEFNGTSLDTSSWNICTWAPGTVNNELQQYTELDQGNIVVSDGTLKIYPKAKLATASNFNILKGEGFTSGAWSGVVQGSAKGSVDFADGKAVIKIDDSGDDNWHIQLQQSELTLTQGHEYEFRMKASSTADRATEISFLDPTDNKYTYYGGGKKVIGTTESEIVIPFTVTEDTVSTIACQINFGKIKNDENNADIANYSVPATVTLSDITVNDLTAEQSGEVTDITKKYEFTSGRIDTMNLHEYTYGRFESRLKVPKGKGYLPAFWLFANEEKYGFWPKTGEIDIMEVLGDSTDTSHHTLHYGHGTGDAHKESGKAVKAEGVDYSAEWHTYICDWEPGKITFYVDDKEVYTVSDWYTSEDGVNFKTYPAPFDHDFYIIYDVAVGGDWPGSPDQAAIDDMNNQSMEVDYVRVYQKDPAIYEAQEENCKRPEKKIDYRKPDENGNYIINGDFAKDIDRTKGSDGDENFILHLEGDAADSTAVVKDGAVTITPSAVGGVDYSVQLKEQSIPMYRGWEYELSFDAYSTENRSMIVDISGPNNSWTRYMEDTTFNITKKKKTYKYTFTMDKKTDENGSLEFNLGNQGSTAPVVLSNIKLTHKSGEEIPEDTSKQICADGNYIINGKFDEGDKGLGSWTETTEKGAISTVKNGYNRELKVVAPEGTSTENPIYIYQDELFPFAIGTYELSMSARMEEGGSADAISLQVAGESLDPELTTTMTPYSKQVKLNADMTRETSDALICVTKPGTYYIDNVKFAESAIIKNGFFASGSTGYDVYADGATASGKVEDVEGNPAFVMTIDDTGTKEDEDYHVQLIKDGFTLEQGEMYKVSFKAKSSIERSIKYAVQQNGNLPGKSWISYSQNGDEIKVGPEWQEFTEIFTMNEPTDDKARFAVTMGNVAGTHITDQHDVVIDDIVIEKNYGMEAPKDLSEAKVTVPEKLEYNGTAQEPTLCVTYGPERIIPSWYDTTYTDNVKVGKNAKVTITGKGKCTGTQDGTFTIGKKVLTVSGLEFEDKLYDGSKYMKLKSQTPKVTGIVKGEDVTVKTLLDKYVITGTCSQGDKQRKLTVKQFAISGKDAANYTIKKGTTATGTIKKVKVAKVKLEKSSAEFNDNAQRIRIEQITGENGKKILQKNCEITYTRNGKPTKDFKSKGKIVVTVTGKDHWKGSASATFTIK